MRVFYSDKKLPNDYSNSIFLAGPTPRTKEIESWRKTALKIFKVLNFKGKIFIPERTNWQDNFNYVDQVDWELTALNNVNVILFWVPRKMDKMPALTTNVEFGLFLKSGKVCYGRPINAEKCRYLDYIYENEYKINPTDTLEETIKNAIIQIKE